jgi:hypothetical protein
MPTNSSLVDLLEAFNRKERFFLVGWALGNPGFALAESFRHELGSALGLRIPSDAFAAMDYHLDWIFASLFLQANSEVVGPYVNDARVNDNQEDVDLLVAFQDRGISQLIMLEAKADTHWTNSQSTSKAKRLRAIFGEDGARWNGVVPHFVIASPRRPSQLSSGTWPEWMAPRGKAIWLAMRLPSGLRRIRRCDESGRRTRPGTHWIVTD